MKIVNYETTAIRADCRFAEGFSTLDRRGRMFFEGAFPDLEYVNGK